MAQFSRPHITHDPCSATLKSIDCNVATTFILNTTTTTTTNNNNNNNRSVVTMGLSRIVSEIFNVE